MSEVLDKRTAEVRWFDLDCTRLLAPTETIQSVSSITADQGGVTFGLPAINSVPIAYPDGRVAAIGKVVQVQISGGAIPDGRPWLLCTLRPMLVTTVDGTNVYNPALEATVILRLIDNPPA